MMDDETLDEAVEQAKEALEAATDDDGNLDRDKLKGELNDAE